VIIAILVWGAAIAGFGLVTWLAGGHADRTMADPDSTPATTCAARHPGRTRADEHPTPPPCANRRAAHIVEVCWSR
jgi:hypothetical protein